MAVLEQISVDTLDTSQVAVLQMEDMMKVSCSLVLFINLLTRENQEVNAAFSYYAQLARL